MGQSLYLHKCHVNALAIVSVLRIQVGVLSERASEFQPSVKKT
jgi:hypothetical protein